MLNTYVSDEGKVFKPKNGEGGYCKAITLGIRDSINNYIQVDESEMYEWEQEQERKEKEEQLKLLLIELYPQDKEEE